MDYEKVMEDFCGDVEAVRSRLQSFASSDTAVRISECIASGDYAGARKLAHTLRKDAEKLGLGELMTKAGRLEEVSDEKFAIDWPGVETLCITTVDAIRGKDE